MINRRLVLAGLGLPAFLQAPASASPQRIVSLNPCMDAMLLELADRQQIAAVSHYSHIRHQSPFYDQAIRHPKTHGTAEEIVSLRPDLVLSTPFETRQMRRVLDQLEIPAIRLDVPENIEENFKQIRELATAIGHPKRAEQLIHRARSAIDQSRPPRGQRLKTLLYQPGGFAAGQGTLIHQMMENAGLDNLAGHYGVGKWGSVSIEQILMDPPELVLISRGPVGQRTRAEQMLDHPALRSISRNIIRADFDESLLYCGGPVLIKTAQALSAARQNAIRQRS